MGCRIDSRGFSLAEVLLAMALSAVAVLTLIALSLSALRSERKSSDSLVGQLVADEAIERLVYDAQANSAHPIWGADDSVNAYAVETIVSSETNFTLVTYARDVDSATFTPRKLKRIEVVSHWWGSESNAKGRSGMGKLEAHAIRLVREQIYAP